MILAVFLLFLGTTYALPQGAPTKACQSMLPNHGGIGRQQEPSPFGVFAQNNGGGYVVSIKSTIGLPFQGYMLQARTLNGLPLGNFDSLPSGTHTIDCDQVGDTVTHNQPVQNSELNLQWYPPSGYEGPVVFNATVAQDYSTFWVGVESSVVQVSRRSVDNLPPTFTRRPIIATTTPPYYTPEQKRTAFRANDPFYNGCYESKLCFGNINNCVEDKNCDFALAITVTGDQYVFEMKGDSQAAWVGIGLSGDGSMGDDSVLECVKEGGVARAYMSYNNPRPNLYTSRLPDHQAGIQLLNGSVIDGGLYCKVKRDPVTSVNGEKYDLINSRYYILLGAGDSVRGNGIGIHTLGKRASAESRYLSDVSSINERSKLLLRLHGAFMVAAWIATASIGTLLARYYRKTWVGKTVCGKDMWFAWHRMFMVTTWALTMVAFVLIFVELKAWSSEDNPHAILGVIVTALCFLQPIGAFFRPHPGTPKRPIFNWGHWFGGNSAHILAIVTIFLAVRLNKAELPKWFDWIVVAFVIFHIVMHLILSILTCASDKSTESRVTSFPMNNMSGPEKAQAHMVNVDAPFGGFRKFLLGLYIIVVIGLTAALIAVIALAPIEE